MRNSKIKTILSLVLLAAFIVIATGCATNRREVRQETRTEGRVEDRYEKRHD